MYQFTLQNYILSVVTPIFWQHWFFFFGMKLKWKPALFTLFLPSGDNLRLGGRPTPPWKVFGQGIFDLPCHYFACEEAKLTYRGAGMSKNLVGSRQCGGHNLPPPLIEIKVTYYSKFGGARDQSPTSPNVPVTLQRGEKEQQHQRETISVPSNKHVLLSCAWHKTPGRVECSLFSCLNRLGCPNIKSVK